MEAMEAEEQRAGISPFSSKDIRNFFRVTGMSLFGVPYVLVLPIASTATYLVLGALAPISLNG